MGDADFARDSIQALNSHAAELGAMYRVVMTAATNRTDIPNIKHIFQEMAEASRECDEMLEIYYGDGDPLSADARRAIQRIQDGFVQLCECVRCIHDDCTANPRLGPAS